MSTHYWNNTCAEDILTLLIKGERHTAKSLYEKLAPRRNEVAVSTVYLALDRLVEAGFVESDNPGVRWTTSMGATTFQLTPIGAAAALIARVRLRAVDLHATTPADHMWFNKQWRPIYKALSNLKKASA